MFNCTNSQLNDIFPSNFYFNCHFSQNVNVPFSVKRRNKIKVILIIRTFTLEKINDAEKLQTSFQILNYYKNIVIEISNYIIGHEISKTL